MRSFVLGVLVAVTMVLTVLSPAAAGLAVSVPSRHTAAVDAAFIERVLQLPLSGFMALTTATHDTWFDWSSDACSAPLVGNTGRSFDFTAPCRRHDFGYRNLRLLEQRYGIGRTYWNAASRLRVDQRFLVDMRNHCGQRRWFEQTTCRAWAVTFYTAVRVAGGP